MQDDQTQPMMPIECETVSSMSLLCGQSVRQYPICYYCVVRVWDSIQYVVTVWSYCETVSSMSLLCGQSVREYPVCRYCVVRVWDSIQYVVTVWSECETVSSMSLLCPVCHYCVVRVWQYPECHYCVVLSVQHRPGSRHVSANQTTELNSLPAAPVCVCVCFC